MACPRQITIDHTEPEAGWPPFMSWLERQGVPPEAAYRVDVFPYDRRMVVEHYAFKRSRRGARVNYGHGREFTTLAIDSMPPIRGPMGELMQAEFPGFGGQ